MQKKKKHAREKQAPLRSGRRLFTGHICLRFFAIWPSALSPAVIKSCTFLKPELVALCQRVIWQRKDKDSDRDNKQKTWKTNCTVISRVRGVGGRTWDICGKRLMASGRARAKAARHTRLWTGRTSLGLRCRRGSLEAHGGERTAIT